MAELGRADEEHSHSREVQAYQMPYPFHQHGGREYDAASVNIQVTSIAVILPLKAVRTTAHTPLLLLVQ